MKVKYIILSLLLIFFVTLFANSLVNKIAEGNTTRPATKKKSTPPLKPMTTSAPVPGLKFDKHSLLGDVYSVVCRDTNFSMGDTIGATKTDVLVNEATDNYVSNVTALMAQYITGLSTTLTKFNNISTALKIGSVELTAPQTQPMVVITPPVNNEIYQTLNFLLPKGKKGKRGKTPGVLVKGPSGNKGYIGRTGVTGTYAVIEQQKHLI